MEDSNVKDELMLTVPQSFTKLKTLPEYPVNSVAYGKKTQSSMCFFMMYPIDRQNAMPYENEQKVIDGIHGALSGNQGLIEVKSGLTNKQRKYIYSIVKSKSSGMRYILTMHIDMVDSCMNIQAYFDEIGRIGFRDNVILNKLVNEGKVTLPNMDGWFKDPYDENYKKGLLMNISEKTEYDVMFAQHPLSEERALVEYIIENK